MRKNYLNKLRLLLLPVSLIYYLITGLRNVFFNLKILPSKIFSVPVICVGNITVGGTGKTPHTELLIELLKHEYFLAILSHGYKRKSKGFVLAGNNISSEILGDESFQIFQNYKNIAVAVCENRVQGINELLKLKSNTQVVILDDAYQHRYVKPGLSILLIDYYRPIFSDFLLPAGNLRESAQGKSRADIIIVTKTPGYFNSEDKKFWQSRLSISPHQKLFFTHFIYDQPVPVFQNAKTKISLQDLQSMNYELLVVTGIAQPKPLIEYILGLNLNCEHLSFSDHHEFSERDLTKIKEKYNSMAGKNKLIITTQKDAVRFRQVKAVPDELISELYYLPIRVEFSEGERKAFESTIREYIKNQPANTK